MPILSDIYSAGNTLKRRIGGLLDDPNGSLEQFVGQLRDDMNRNSDLMNQAGWGQIDRVKYTPEQRAAAQKKLADIGTNMAMSAATVWHGSPHKFDKFDASKIGTGEGAQAYGHGLYLADSKEVADTYKKALTHADDFVDGQLLDASIPKHFIARILNEESGNVLAAKESLESIARPGGSKSVADSAKQALKLLEGGQRPVMQTIKPEGALYKVDLPDEHIAKMLDWDKPLSQQPVNIQQWLKDAYNPHRKQLTAQDVGGNEPNGQLIVNRLQELMAEGKRSDVFANAANAGSSNASREMREAGIPGIRYLDGGSRGTGQGTSNFVVFPGNEGILKILERNGQPLGLLGD